MKSILILGLMLLGPFSYAQYSDWNQNALQAVWKGAENCDLQVAQSNNPLFEYIIGTAQGQVIAGYSSQSLFLPVQSHRFMSPNGQTWYGSSLVNGVHLSFQNARFANQTVASVYHNWVGGFGKVYRYQCRGRNIANLAQFHLCVERYYVRPLIRELCRFSN